MQRTSRLRSLLSLLFVLSSVLLVVLMVESEPLSGSAVGVDSLRNAAPGYLGQMINDPRSRIVDNSDAGFQKAGVWDLQSSQWTKGYKKNRHVPNRYAYQTEEPKARWNFPDMSAGTYHVMVPVWFANYLYPPYDPQDVSYEVFRKGTDAPLLSVAEPQVRCCDNTKRTDSNGPQYFKYGGTVWHSVGTVTIAQTEELRVILSGNKKRVMYADAVALVRVPDVIADIHRALPATDTINAWDSSAFEYVVTVRNPNPTTLTNLKITFHTNDYRSDAPQIKQVTSVPPGCSYVAKATHYETMIVCDKAAAGSPLSLAPDGVVQLRFAFTTNPMPVSIFLDTHEYYVEVSANDGLSAAVQDVIKINISAPAGSCGNGKLDQPEQCDDGNAESGDGCNRECKHEAMIVSSIQRIVPAADQPISTSQQKLKYQYTLKNTGAVTGSVLSSFIYYPVPRNSGFFVRTVLKSPECYDSMVSMGCPNPGGPLMLGPGKTKTYIATFDIRPLPCGQTVATGVTPNTIHGYTAVKGAMLTEKVSSCSTTGN